MNEPPLIEIANATVWRGTTRVFDRFSLTIEQHERVAILGRDRWNVWELREHIGLVSQDLQSGFMPNATVFDTIVSGFFSSIGVHYQLRAQIDPWQMEKASEVLRSLGLEELRGREFKTLSTGQQRRCLLGRALVHDPDTLILDEPTSGLDMSASFDYLARIREMAQRGRNVLLVTHRLNEIPPEIERVIVLKGGKVLADGPEAEVINGETISRAFDAAISVMAQGGHYLAYPAEEV